MLIWIFSRLGCNPEQFISTMCVIYMAISGTILEDVEQAFPRLYVEWSPFKAVKLGNRESTKLHKCINTICKLQKLKEFCRYSAVIDSKYLWPHFMTTTSCQHAKYIFLRYFNISDIYDSDICLLILYSIIYILMM